VFRVGEQAVDKELSFAGEVKARYETKLSFRVPGKIIYRRVEIGDRVRNGQLLAQLDPIDYQLASKSLASQLAAAHAERDFAKDDLNRYRELLELKYISHAEYDRRETVYTTANDRVEALQSQLNQANNQTSYTNLYADREGVVTALEFETGQVVAAGQVILSLAQLDQIEVVMSIPENRIADLGHARDVAVTLWADGDRRLKGHIREISPGADPASRTYTVKVSLLEGKDIARLGMTATVYFPPSKTNLPTIPLAAVFEPQDNPFQARVWVVDERTKTVKSIPVTLGVQAINQQVAVSGLSPGETVVSAGVTRLLEGQAVKILGEEKIQAFNSPGPRRVATDPELHVVSHLK
jgi:RND family efflux transporter MFP subunit